MQISYTSGEQVQVYKFSLPVSVGVPLIAVFLQAYIPVYLHFFSIFDLPLLVTIFFAVARRGQISGLATGSIIGLFQDSLTHQPIGLYGIAKTVVGYMASSLGVKLDVENPGSRFLMTFIFYVIHQLIYIVLARGLAGLALQMSWHRLVIAAVVNAALAIPFFAMLDRFKQRT